MTTDTKAQDTIVLEENQAAMVFNGDGTIDVHLPEPKDDKDMATQSHLLCVAVAHLITERGELIVEALETIEQECKALEEADVSSDTDCCGSEDCDCNHGEPV